MEDERVLTPEELYIAESEGITAYLATLPSDYDDYLDDKDGSKRRAAGLKGIALAQLAKAQPIIEKQERIRIGEMVCKDTDYGALPPTLGVYDRLTEDFMESQKEVPKEQPE